MRSRAPAQCGDAPKVTPLGPCPTQGGPSPAGRGLPETSLGQRCKEERTRTWARRASIFEQMRGARCAERAGSLPGLPAPQSPSRDPSREGRPGRVGGGGRGGRRLPHRLARAAGWGGDSRHRSERRTEGSQRREAAPAPAPCSTAGPSRRGGRISVLRAAGGASSPAAGRGPCLRAARRVCPAGAAPAPVVGLLGCLSDLLPPAPSSGLVSPDPRCSSGR